MRSSKVFVRGLLLLMLSTGVMASPLVLSVGQTGNVRAEGPVITASDAIRPDSESSTPAQIASGNLVSYKQAPLQQAVTHIVISEFRSRGPSTNGYDQDEFVELFNPTGLPVAITGWALWTSDCSLSTAGSVYTFGAVTLPAGGHYLVGGLNYSGSATPDIARVNIGLADSGGLALRDSPTEPANTIDQVGTCHLGPSDFYETAPLAPLTGNLDQSYDRKSATGGSCQDTDNNAIDFFLRRPSDPQNSFSLVTTCGNPTPTPTPTASSSPTLPPPPATLTSTPAALGTATTAAANTLTATSAAATSTLSSTRSPTASPTRTPGGTPGSYPPLSVIINEVGWSGTGASSADEWLELYNHTSGSINLRDWQLIGIRAGSITQFTITFADSDTIPAGGYFVVKQNDGVFLRNMNANQKTASALALIDTGLILQLVGPLEEQVDTANYAGGSWPAGSSNLSLGRPSMERYRSTSDTRSNWLTFNGPTTPLGSLPQDRRGNAVHGTPGRVNWAAGVIKTAVPTATKGRRPTPIPPTPFAHMVINEFLPRAGTDWNQDGKIDVYDEFIEVKNLGPIDVDLGKWKLDDELNAGSPPFTLPSKKLKPGERAVYYGLVTKILLDDSGDTVRLINPTGIVFDARGYGPVADPDQSHCRIPDGYYWRHPCFPTPGLENRLTGTAPAAPPVVANGPPPCLLADTVPAPFREAECNAYGADMWDQTYWDRLAGQRKFPVPDIYNKAITIVE